MSQELCGLEVLLGNGVHHHLEDHLDVGGVSCRGEVGVHHLANVVHLSQEEHLDEDGRGLHVVVGTCKQTGIHP